MNPVGKRTVWIERKRSAIALHTLSGDVYVIDPREVPHLLEELARALVGWSWRR